MSGEISDKPSLELGCQWSSASNTLSNKHKNRNLKLIERKKEKKKRKKDRNTHIFKTANNSQQNIVGLKIIPSIKNPDRANVPY